MTFLARHADQAGFSALSDAAAAAARYAPSVLNTQPWHWRVHRDRLELFAEHSRQLTVTDPDGRLLMLSCGAALDHVCVALAEQGWRPHVTRSADAATPHPLAVVHAAERVAITPESRQRARAMRLRHTDRRPVSDQPLPSDAVRAIVAAVRRPTRLQVLSAEQVLDLSAAATRAADVQAGDRLVCDELDYWTGRTVFHGAGLPAAVLPDRPSRTTVPGRDFHRAGTLPIGPGHDRAALYAVLYGEEDGAEDWMRAGEALSAAWLTATEVGASMVPLSDVTSVPGTRQSLRRMLCYLGYPYLAIRLGIADPETGTPRRTPRLPTAEVVDVSGLAPRQPEAR